MAGTAPAPPTDASGNTDRHAIGVPVRGNGAANAPVELLRIVLIDPAALTRESLAHLLRERAYDFSIETLADCEAADHCSEEPAVIVVNGKSLDIIDPALTAISAKLAEVWPGTPCMLISERPSDPTVALRAIQSGWRGFFPATLEVDLLTAAIRLVMLRGIFLPPTVLEALCAGQ